ncbi:MAG: hypothetical protein U1F57_11290 [bacterium]
MIGLYNIDFERENSIFSRSSLSQSASLTSTQSQIDEIVGHFSEEATQWQSLAALGTGSVFYRLGRIGTLALPFARPQPLQLLSYGVGLFSEVSAYETTRRFLNSFSGDRPNPNLWNWNGRGGLQEGIFSSLITFGILKGAGHFTQGQNTILQHLFSDFAMVGGHQVSASFGLTPRSNETLAEQLLHAEVTNLQLGAGMSLMRSLAPGTYALERGLDLSIRSSVRRTLEHSEGETILPLRWATAALDLPGERPPSSPHSLRPAFMISACLPENVQPGSLGLRDASPGESPAARPSYEENILADGSREITFIEGNPPFSLPEGENTIDSSNRKAHAFVSEKLNAGIPSLSAALRESGWGPLWVRRTPGGNQLRFNIPNPLLKNSVFSSIDSYGNGPETSLERNLREGFFVSPASMDLAIRELLRTIPGGPPITRARNPATGHSGISYKLILNNLLRHRRLEALHLLLADGDDPSRLITLENGAGPIVDFSVSLALRGYPVLIKENDAIMQSCHRRGIRDFPPGVTSLITYHDQNDVNAPTPADRVYWINPSPTTLIIPEHVSLEDYLSRDVKPGGYLIIQSDTVLMPRYNYQRLQMDPSRWETLFKERITGRDESEEYLLPTSNADLLHLQIYRRKP